MRGDHAALHTSFLRTWTAFLTRYCSRVVFEPPTSPFVRCPHNDCQTMPLHQHRSTIFKHFRPQHSLILKRFLVLSILSISPVFSSVKLRSVFCAVVLSTCLRVRTTVGKQQMCTCGARKRCQNLTSTMKHGVPMMWTTTSLLVGLRRRVEDFCRRRLRFVLVCIESWDVRRCETHWVPP